MATRDFDIKDFFVNGAGAWIDSQREVMRPTEPVYNTQDGVAGQSQPTSYADVLRNPVLIGVAVVAVIALIALLAKN